MYGTFPEHSHFTAHSMYDIVMKIPCVRYFFNALKRFLKTLAFQLDGSKYLLKRKNKTGEYEQLKSMHTYCCSALEMLWGFKYRNLQYLGQVWVGCSVCVQELLVKLVISPHCIPAIETHSF